MGYPVVDDGCRREPAAPLAFHAQRMRGQVSEAGLAPCVTVAPLCGRPPYDPLESRAGVRRAVPPFDEGGTSWVRAAARRTSRQQKSRAKRLNRRVVGVDATHLLGARRPDDSGFIPCFAQCTFRVLRARRAPLALPPQRIHPPLCCVDTIAQGVAVDAECVRPFLECAHAPHVDGGEGLLLLDWQ